MERAWIITWGVGIAALPLAALTVYLLYRRRQPDAAALRTSIADVAMVVGTLPWLYLTLRPVPNGPERVYLVPFEDITTLPEDILFVQVVGNLLIFAPLGFFLPVRWEAFASIWRVLGVGAAASCAIEITQLLVGSGRVTSIDDVLLNALGAALAACLSRPWWRREQEAARMP